MALVAIDCLDSGPESEYRHLKCIVFNCLENNDVLYSPAVHNEMNEVPQLEWSLEECKMREVVAGSDYSV